MIEYRLNLEVVLHAIAIGFSGLESILSLLAIIMFLRIDNTQYMQKGR